MTASFLPGWKNPRANEPIRFFRCSRWLQTVSLLLLAAFFFCFLRFFPALSGRWPVSAFRGDTGLAAFVIAAVVALHLFASSFRGVRSSSPVMLACASAAPRQPASLGGLLLYFATYSQQNRP